MYVKDKSRFLVFKPGEPVSDGKIQLPAMQDLIYGGHYNDRMTAAFTENAGKLTPEMVIKDIIPKIAMPSNFQNVVYDPVNLRMWISNARDSKSRAADGAYTLFDLKAAIASSK